MAEAMNGLHSGHTSAPPISTRTYKPLRRGISRNMNFAGVVMVREPVFCPTRDLTLRLDAPWLHSAARTEEPIHTFGNTAATPTRRPRPYDQETWQEEEGRRTRFALQDSDDTSNSDEAHQSAPDLHLAGATHHAREQLTQGLDSSNWSSFPFAYLVDTLDSLTVDDNIWTYDLSDFMDQWRLEQTRTVSPTYPSTELRSPQRVKSSTNELFRHKDYKSGHDLQGIDWTSLGTTRRLVMDARQGLYPFPQQSPQAWAQKAGHRTQDIDDEEHHYRFRSFAPRDNPPRFSHCQLRSMLVGNHRSDIYYGSANKVMRTSLSQATESSTILDLSRRNFKISTLAVSPPSLDPQILIAGGFDGDFVLHNFSDCAHHTTPSHLSSTPNSLVNHISIHASRLAGPPQATFATNDSNLRQLDLTTSTQTAIHSYSHAINHTTTSPCNRLRVLVGDSTDVLLTTVDKGDIITTLTGHEDDGFACTWSADGRHLATGAEDGVVKIWDARNFYSPVTDIACVMGCARSLEFTPAGILVIAEGEDVLSFYDVARDVKQDVRYFGCMTGLAVLGDGDEIVVANGDRSVGGLMTFEEAQRGYWNEEMSGLCI